MEEIFCSKSFSDWRFSPVYLAWFIYICKYVCVHLVVVAAFCPIFLLNTWQLTNTMCVYTYRLKRRKIISPDYFLYTLRYMYVRTKIENSSRYERLPFFVWKRLRYAIKVRDVEIRHQFSERLIPRFFTTRLNLAIRDGAATSTYYVATVYMCNKRLWADIAGSNHLGG